MIPFNKPVWLGTEVERITRAIVESGHIAGGGPFGRYCEEFLGRQLGQPTLLVTSCTHALEMAGLLLELAPGDEFIVPAYTFVSTANAFAIRGARPVFADVDENGNLDPAEVDRLRTPRTKAVVPVHYAGNSCDMEELAAACGAIPIIEDAAQALDGQFDGRPLGTYGACGAFSFHETKNVGCGEGGALTIRDGRLLERAEYIRDKGTNRRRFLSGLVDKYTWVDVGSSYVLSDLNAAYLSAQLDQLGRIQERRSSMHRRYTQELAARVERRGAYTIQAGPRNTPNHHLMGHRLPVRRGEGSVHRPHACVRNPRAVPLCGAAPVTPGEALPRRQEAPVVGAALRVPGPAAPVLQHDRYGAGGSDRPDPGVPRWTVRDSSR